MIEHSLQFHLCVFEYPEMSVYVSAFARHPVYTKAVFEQYLKLDAHNLSPAKVVRIGYVTSQMTRGDVGASVNSPLSKTNGFWGITCHLVGVGGTYIWAHVPESLNAAECLDISSTVHMVPSEITYIICCLAMVIWQDVWDLPVTLRALDTFLGE